MRPIPQQLRARSHGQLLSQIRQHAREVFKRQNINWDPSPEEENPAPDLGREVLDCFALALHVLWVYQEVWAEEGFISSATLPGSVHRILDLIGYSPTPGSAATGLQHFRCKAGTQSTLPPGFQVGASAEGDAEAATYELVKAINVSSVLNEMNAYLPDKHEPKLTIGAIAAVSKNTLAALQAPEVKVPRASNLVAQIEGRVAAARSGDLAQRNAAHAQQQALKLADFISAMQDNSAGTACATELDQLCQELCELQNIANAVPQSVTPGRMSESQELLLSQLKRLLRRQPQVLSGLEEALSRAQGESDQDWSRRLDQFSAFLDALINSLLQEARDQVVLLHGPQALSRLDQSLSSVGATAVDLGVAPPGTDHLYLLPFINDVELGPSTQTKLLSPGDWLVLAEDIQQVAADGKVSVQRRYRESVQVTRIREEKPKGRSELMTHINFRPPLRRRYVLSKTVVLGNIGLITHGESVVEQGRRFSVQQPILDLSQGPLTWVRDVAEQQGLRPEVEMVVAERSWQRVPDLRNSEPTGSFFTVEVTPEGKPQVRIGDGREGATMPRDATVSLRYRVGIGSDGNRRPGAVDSIKSSNPSLASTLNPLPVSGGSDPESPEIAQRKARAGIHALDRAIGLSDVRSLTQSYSGIRCAQVFRDSLRRREHINIVVCGEYAESFNADERASIKKFLLARTPPGTSLSIKNRKLVPIKAQIRLFIEAEADPIAVVAEARVRLGLDESRSEQVEETQGLLHRSRVELGKDVTLSDFYQALSGIADLRAVHVERLYRSGTPPACNDRIRVMADEVAVWAAEEDNGEPVEIFWQEAGST